MKKYFYLILNVCLIHFLLGLDINIVSVSLPYISAHFQVSMAVVSRIVWIYFLILTCLLLAFGKIGDIKGFRKIYISGILLFLTGSFLCGVSQSFSMLVFFRIIQAFGSAVLFALTPAVIASEIPAELRGRVYGINYSFTSLGGIIGRAASGFIVENFGWNSVFLISIPLGLITIYFSYKYIKEINFSGHRFDYYGTILIFAGLFSLLFALNTGEEKGWTSPFITGLFLISVILIGFFIFRQKKAEHPLLDFRILKDKKISMSVLTFVFVYIITNGMIYLSPFYLTWIKNYPKEQTGLLMAVPSVMQFFSGYLSGYLSDKSKGFNVCSAGIILITVTTGLCILLSPESELLMIILIFSLYGFSIGFFIPSNTANIMKGAPINDKGSVSSLMTTSVRLGSTFGVVLFGLVFMSFVPEKNPLQAGISPDVIITGFRAAFLFGSFAGLMGIITVYMSSEKKIENS
jgi:EmrB/QacA subfamily drug resistance transporter